MRCDCSSALATPYYECTRCELDYDDETFFRAKQHREEPSSVPHARLRRRLLDTICKACRQEERDLGKGSAVAIDWASIEFGRFMASARNAVAAHAARARRSAQDFARDGWLAPRMAERFQATRQCEYCERPFSSLADQTVDVVVPRDGYSWELNTRIACRTCNNGKQSFEGKPNARELIDRWQQNWRRWLRHQGHGKTGLVVVSLATAPPLRLDLDPDGQYRFA